MPYLYFPFLFVSLISLSHRDERSRGVLYQFRTWQMVAWLYAMKDVLTIFTVFLTQLQSDNLSFSRIPSFVSNAIRDLTALGDDLKSWKQYNKLENDLENGLLRDSGIEEHSLLEEQQFDGDRKKLITSLLEQFEIIFSPESMKIINAF
jgi:hypothetical protein